MTNLSRRALFKRAAVIPVAAAAVASNTHQLAGLNGSGALAALGGGESACSPIAGNGGVRCLTFTDWLIKGGEVEIKASADYVSSLDPDLAESLLPLATRFRMQKKRNFKKALKNKKSLFARRLLQNPLGVEDYF